MFYFLLNHHYVETYLFGLFGMCRNKYIGPTSAFRYLYFLLYIVQMTPTKVLAFILYSLVLHTMVKYLSLNIMYGHFPFLKYRMKHFASDEISAQVSCRIFEHFATKLGSSNWVHKTGIHYHIEALCYKPDPVTEFIKLRSTLSSKA